jgi:hypothetical protein
VATWETVCELLDQLPGTEQGLIHGNPAVRVGKKLVACVPDRELSRPAEDADDDLVMVKVDFDERGALLAQDPRTFFVTPHYENYRAVLVRLSTVEHDQLRELLTEAWRLTAPKRMVREFDES